jgi:hypothetical protein
MKRISSRSTSFYKRVFPAIWFGFLGLFVLAGFFAHPATNAAPTALLIVPLVMAVFGYVLFRRLLFDLVDEVWDDTDALIVRNAGAEDRVALGNIINIGYSMLTNPERVTLTLRNPSSLGKEITFLPLMRSPWGFRGFSRNPIIGELIDRVDRARREST